jgi:hypothetical protein
MKNSLCSGSIITVCSLDTLVWLNEDEKPKIKQKLKFTRIDIFSMMFAYMMLF